MTTNGASGRGRGTDRRSFERNRFFHGKLMTARDMQTEQEYHVGRLHTLSRLVLGHGIVCGLAVAAVEDAGEQLEVTIEPGVALDRAGRPIVVEDTATVRLPTPQTEPIYLYVEYNEASKERVPVPGAEHSYEQECTYNRILETYDVYYRSEPPDHPKAVQDVAFPERGDVGDDGTALTALARTYHETHLGPDDDTANPDVFLGSFERQNGEWAEVTGPQGRPYVYTNDMLYDALAQHAADFENPHDVSVEGVSQDVLDAIEEFEGVGALVDRLDAFEDRLGRVEAEKTALERYVLNETLEAKIEAFEHVNVEFGSGTAAEIVERSRKRLHEPADMDRTDYVEFVDTVLEWETALEHELEGDATSDRLEQYSTALAELQTVRDELGDDESIVPLAAAQRQVCNTARSLTQS